MSIVNVIMSMKNSSDTIEDQTRDLPACSAVLQPTAPPRAPSVRILKLDYYRHGMRTSLNRLLQKGIEISYGNFPQTITGCIRRCLKDIPFITFVCPVITLKYTFRVTKYSSEKMSNKRFE
jgi:hypothetical protein